MLGAAGLVRPGDPIRRNNQLASAPATQDKKHTSVHLPNLLSRLLRPAAETAWE